MHAKCKGVSPRLFLTSRFALFNDNNHNESTDELITATWEGLSLK